ncbi:MAG: radical SAM protein [Candidatus Helarchaeota archaeon]|nr:radical SAM protein [Candidatus Helarchaeota archaeon]
MTLSQNSILRAISIENIKRAIPLGMGQLKRHLIKVPFAVNYDLTYKCNLRCEHCYFFSSVEEKRRENAIHTELTDNQWLKVFKYHKSRGITSAAITGGEPTLRMNLLYDAVKIFPRVQIATNGIIKIPKFPKNKQPLIWTSIDGLPETHNAIRGAEIYDRIIENIRDDKRVLISTTVTTSNYDEIEDIVKELIKINVSGLFFLFYTGYPNDPLLLKGKYLQKAVQSISKVMNEYEDFIVISKKMIQCYITKAHVPGCLFKNGGIQSFYPNGERKFCVMGNSPLLCANCGCIVPVASYCISKFDPETIEKLKKFPL